VRKFDQPFDSYQLSVERPMIVELSPQRGHYNHLINNPIYYFHAFQYTHGELYRAVLGYEKIWDHKLEKDLMMALDFMMCKWASDKKYYLEEIVINRKTYIEGVKWFRGIKPTPLNLQLRYRFKKARNCRALARINTLDQPFHVDLEFANGDIFTMPYISYITLKLNKKIRSLDHANDTSRKTESHAENDGHSAVKRLESLGREIAIKAIHGQLSGLRQRVRRKSTL
jgi:hypothetical protein